jgi:hypothetical protein
MDNNKGNKLASKATALETAEVRFAQDLFISGCARRQIGLTASLTLTSCCSPTYGVRKSHCGRLGGRENRRGNGVSSGPDCQTGEKGRASHASLASTSDQTYSVPDTQNKPEADGRGAVLASTRAEQKQMPPETPRGVRTETATSGSKEIRKAVWSKSC